MPTIQLTAPQTAQETTTDPAADVINSGVKFEPNLHSVCQDLQSNIKNDDLKLNFFMNKKCLQLLYMFAQKYVDVLLPLIGRPSDPDALDI